MEQLGLLQLLDHVKYALHFAYPNDLKEFVLRHSSVTHIHTVSYSQLLREHILIGAGIAQSV
jgi:hypothetical protein